MPAPAGQPVPIGYGFVWGTGIPIHAYMRQNTGSDDTDFTRIGGWILGRNEWDGLEELWDSALDRLLFTNELQDTTKLHFHRGCDSVIGSGMAAVSVGPDQGVDSFHQYLPPGVQPLTYNRMANYWLMMKNFVNDPEDDDQSKASNFADLNPIGLWRAGRVRIFDESGNMTGYAFSTNPAWQMVDVALSQKLFPEHNIDLANGADDLTTAVRRRFEWGAIAAAADKYDQINDQNRRNYEGHWLFTQPGTMQAMLSPMLQACRSYQKERSGKLGFYHDQARASVFGMTRKNTASFTPDDSDLSTAADRFVMNFRDLLIPAIRGYIISISFPDHRQPLVAMDQPHGLAPGDRIVIGGTNTTYDTYWTVDTVPDDYSFTLKNRGSNYPSSVGGGGQVGLSYSRFKERSPEWNHKRRQYARGAIGVGIPRQREKLKVEIDMGTTTFDQASRIAKYEKQRSLGSDVSPYVTPVVAQVVLDLFAVDTVTGNKAIGCDPGDRFEADDTLSVPYVGSYEILEVETTPDAVLDGGGTRAGRVALKLGPYDPLSFVDVSDPTEASWPDVPGSDPGNSTNATDIPLADGDAQYYTGLAATGDTIPIPTGFNPNTFMGWAGAAGYVEADHQLHCFRNCDFDPVSRILSCIYSDGNKYDSNIWNGDGSYAGLVSRTLHSLNVITVGDMTYRELTLRGGEKVLWGSGLVSGAGSLSYGPASFSQPLLPPYTVALPDGYSLEKSVCIALIKDGVERGDHDAHGFAAWVDNAGLVHSLYQDGDGNQWAARQVRLHVFAWKNNLGTVVRDALGWWKIPLGLGVTLAWAGFDIFDAALGGAAPPNHPSTPLRTITNGVLQLPDGFTQKSLQAITGPMSFQIVDHPTHGIRACYLNGDLQSQSSFEDGEGHVWYGTAGGFFLLCDVAPATGVIRPLAFIDGAGVTAHPGETSVLSVTLQPGDSSTGISVNVDLTLIGGSSSQAMSLSGAPNAYTYTATIDARAVPGAYSLPVSIADAQGGSAAGTIALTLLAVAGAFRAADIEVQTAGGVRLHVSGFLINDGGQGYTSSATAQLDGASGEFPYDPVTRICGLVLDSNGSITAITGGTGGDWSSPPILDIAP